MIRGIFSQVLIDRIGNGSCVYAAAAFREVDAVLQELVSRIGVEVEYSSVIGINADTAGVIGYALGIAGIIGKRTCALINDVAVSDVDVFTVIEQGIGRCADDDLGVRRQVMEITDAGPEGTDIGGLVAVLILIEDLRAVEVVVHAVINDIIINLLGINLRKDIGGSVGSEDAGGNVSCQYIDNAGEVGIGPVTVTDVLLFFGEGSCGSADSEVKGYASGLTCNKFRNGGAGISGIIKLTVADENDIQCAVVHG